MSALPEHENRTYPLQHLIPGEEYKVWIRAVNAAGPGEKTITMFTTPDQELSGTALRPNSGLVYSDVLFRVKHFFVVLLY